MTQDDDRKFIGDTSTIAEMGAEIVNNMGKSPEELWREKSQKQIAILMEGKTPKAPLFYETMTQAMDPGSGARIRIWRNVKELTEYADTEVQLVLSKIPASATMQQVADIICTIDNVTAFELTDRNGNGVVAYVEW